MVWIEKMPITRPLYVEQSAQNIQGGSPKFLIRIKIKSGDYDESRELCSSRYWFKGGCVISNTRFNSSAHKSSFKVPRKINITEKRIYTCHTFQLSAQNTPLSSCTKYRHKESLCEILFKSWLCSVGFYCGKLKCMRYKVVDKRPTWFWCRRDLSATLKDLKNMWKGLLAFSAPIEIQMAQV